MKALISKLDEKKTIQNVEDHLQSFSYIRHYYTVIDANESPDIPHQTKITILDNQEYISTSNKMLRQIDLADTANRITQKYIEKMLSAINRLSAFQRQLILCQYFYEMDFQELEEFIGFGERTLRSNIKDAKLSLAFFLQCEEYE